MGVDWRFFGVEVFCSSIGAVSSPVNLLLLLLFHASHVVCVVLLCIPPYLFFFFVPRLDVSGFGTTLTTMTPI